MSTNHLIHEKSPYLLQHAHNPVDWHAWSDTAFAQARAEDKPIFLSVGYATCHWCHVMEHESFDQGLAAALAEHLDAPCMTLDELKAENLYRAVKQEMR